MKRKILTLLAFASAGSVASGALVNRYSFDNPAGDATGAVLTDSVSGADGVVQGAGANFSGTGLDLPGGSSNSAAYGDLPNGLISSHTSVTIEGWVTVDGFGHSWARFFDFGSTAPGAPNGEITGPGNTNGGGTDGRDYILLSAARGGDYNSQRLEVRDEDPAGGGISTHDSFVPTVLGEPIHFAVTWEDTGPGTGVVNYWRNGVKLTDNGAIGSNLSDLNDVNNWLGRSNWLNDGNLNGTFDEFRIYNHAFDGAEVAGSIAEGPDDVLEITDGLVNYWPLDSHLKDCAHDVEGTDSSVADDGVFDGANGTDGISFGTGLFGAGIDQNGAVGLGNANLNDGFVRVARSADTLFGANATNPTAPDTVTTSMWVQAAGFDTNWQTMLSHGEGGQYRIARLNNGNAAAYAGGTGDIGGGNIAAGSGWHHVVGISEGGVNTRLWVDGVLVSTSANPPNIDDNRGGVGAPLDLFIGANPNTGAQNREWWGQIDDVAQWNRALSANEITQLYGGGPASASPLGAWIEEPEIAVLCDLESPAQVADSQAEFSGTQGQDGWSYGYYNTTVNGSPTDGSSLIPFNGGAGGGPWNGTTQQWTGTEWRLHFNAPGPWTSVNAVIGHPNGTNSAPGHEHWATRRWVVEPGQSGDLVVNWTLAAQNLGSTGTTLHVLHNGVIVDSGVTNLAAGVSGSVVIPKAQVGDWIDLALTPVGVDGDPRDFSDGSFFGATIEQLRADVCGNTVPVDLGVACPGEPICKEFTICNAGDSELRIDSIAVSTGYSLVGGTPTTVAPGGEEVIKVQFDANPAPLGDYAGTLTIWSNDCDEDPCVVALTALLETPPTIFCAEDIVTNAPAGGTATVSYAHIFAIDTTDGPRPVDCTPPDTTAFPIGVTTVTCTSTDLDGKTTIETFDVIVLEIQPAESERFIEAGTVSIRGDFPSGPAPGTVGGLPKGASLFAYNNAYLNNSEEVVMKATFSSAGTNNVAVLSDASGSLETLGIRNLASPAGPDYTIFRTLAIADDSTSSFGGQTTAGDSHITDSGATTTLLVGASPPGMTGSPLVSTIYQPALSAGGELFSAGKLALGSGAPAVLATDDTFVWSSIGGAAAREGGAAADIAGATYGHIFSRVVSNDDGQIAFAGNVAGAGGANAAVWSGLPGALAVVAQRGDAAPGTGSTYQAFQAESISPVGTTVIRATVANVSGSVTSANNEGLWTDRSGSLALVARENDVAPCDDPDTRFKRFTTTAIDSNGKIVFFAFLQGATVNSANDGSVWCSDPDGSLRLIAREGQIANNTDGAVIATLDVVGTSDANGIVYSARLSTGVGDTTTSTNVGIWLDGGDGDDAAELLVRKGDTTSLGKTERTITNAVIDYVSNAVGGTGGYGRIISDGGKVVVRLSFTGSSSGVFTLPEDVPG